MNERILSEPQMLIEQEVENFATDLGEMESAGKSHEPKPLCSILSATMPLSRKTSDSLSSACRHLFYQFYISKFWLKFTNNEKGLTKVIPVL